MQPIKVNHIGDAGKRTTTTISYAICSFYAHQVGVTPEFGENSTIRNFVE